MDNLLSEDVSINDDGYALTRILVTPRHQVVRVEVWEPSDDKANNANSAGYVLDCGQGRTSWSAVLELSHTSWPATPKPTITPPKRDEVVTALGPVADEVYRRMRTVLDYVSNPVLTVVPVVNVAVNESDTGAPVAFYGDYDEAHRTVDKINRQAGRTVLSVGRPVPHNPAQTVLQAMVDQTSNPW